jgi:hypothetical protein
MGQKGEKERMRAVRGVEQLPDGFRISLDK